jgi:transmembrane protein 222
MRSTPVRKSLSSGTCPADPLPGSTKKQQTTATTTPRRPITAPSRDREDSPFVMEYTKNSSETSDHNNNNAIRKDELAYTIVWSPLPPITWLLPFIGHTGICDSTGVASDFRGPYYVGEDGRMAFGPPTRALDLKEYLGDNVTQQQYDDCIRTANEVYRGRMHNICCDNCHSHVAFALNQMKLSAFGIQKWDMVKIALLMFVRGRFLSLSGFWQQFLPLVLLICVIVWITSS